MNADYKQSPLVVTFPFATPDCAEQHGSVCDHAVPSPCMLVMAIQTGLGWAWSEGYLVFILCMYKLTVNLPLRP
jgi:hypothetical protein